MNDSSLDASAMDLARRIRRREVSPVELVDAHIERIAAVNPAINAMIAERSEAARREAKAAESEVARARDPDTPPPLAGDARAHDGGSTPPRRVPNRALNRQGPGGT